MRRISGHKTLHSKGSGVETEQGIYHPPATLFLGVTNMAKEVPYMSKYPVVHIYGQYAHHMEAIILGNKVGLMALKKAINTALCRPEGRGSQEVYVNDGEGYYIEIQVIQDERIDNLPVPYTADYAQDKCRRLAACALFLERGIWKLK